MEELIYRKSSFSSGAQQCVEVAVAANGDRYVRDTKDRSLPPHRFTAEEWTAFTAGVRAGEFD